MIKHRFIYAGFYCIFAAHSNHSAFFIFRRNFGLELKALWIKTKFVSKLCMSKLCMSSALTFDSWS